MTEGEYLTSEEEVHTVDTCKTDLYYNIHINGLIKKLCFHYPCNTSIWIMVILLRVLLPSQTAVKSFMQ